MTGEAFDGPGLIRASVAGLGPVGLAVSGGGDSIALMHLAVAAGLRPAVATVNHGLRPEAGDEAAMVGAQARALGLTHSILHWDGRSASGNLMDAARLARRQLLADWAKSAGLEAVLLGHTQDDVAETFLMRLARGAGVDGLSVMAARFQAEGMVWLRPFLGVPRAALRDVLRAKGVTWAEDPTNDDAAYDRARARQALGALGGLGLDAARLAEVAGHLGQARLALEAAADELLLQAVRVEGRGLALRINRDALLAAPAETLRRAVVAIILWLAPAPYAPRGAQVAEVIQRLAGGQVAQLQGARFFPHRGGLWACAEGATDRWQVTGALPDGATLGALGPDGLRQCPEARRQGLPRVALLAAPAMWHQGRLLAAPHGGLMGQNSIILRGPAHPALRNAITH